MLGWKKDGGRSPGPTSRTATMGALLCLLLSASPAAAQEAAGPQVTVEPGSGATIEEEGSYRLRISGRFQLREDLHEDDGVSEMETLLRRVRLSFDGYVFDESLTYKLQLGLGPTELDNAGSPILDAYILWKASRDLQLQVGQSTIPFERQRETSSGRLQFVDRSRVVDSFQIDRDLGVTLRSDDLFGLDGRLGYRLGVYGGEGRGRTTAPVGFLYLARAEVRPFGAFADYVEADLERSSRPRLAFAGTIAWNEDAVRSRGNRGGTLELVDGFDGFDYFHLAGDATFKWQGLSVLGEILWQQAENDGTAEAAGIEAHEGWGWFVQAGQLIGPRWEIGARYGERRADEADSSLAREFADQGRELGVVASWYAHGHPFKLQADYFRYWGLEHDGLPARSFGDAIQEVRLQLQASF